MALRPTLNQPRYQELLAMGINSIEALRANKEFFDQKLFEEMLRDRPAINAQTRTTLRNALRLGNRSDLLGETLLDRNVHKRHTSYVVERLRKLAKSASGRSRLKAEDRNDFIKEKLRFVSVLFSAEDLDTDHVLSECERFRTSLRDCMKAGAKGSLGSIEVEVVNASYSDELEVFGQEESTVNKLKTIQQLTPVTASGNKCLALIHYHGLVVLNERGDQGVRALRDALASRGFCSADRQTEIKRLTDEFGGKRKTLDQSLFHIGRYITKGGNKLIGERIAFEYKASFNQSDLKREKELLRGHRDAGTDLHREKMEEGIENPLAMTYEEVLFQAIVIDGLMGTSKDRRGYLIKT